MCAQDRAKLRVEQGLAAMRDFVMAIGPEITYLRCVIIARSRFFALIRFHGWEPRACAPLDVAASIAALPLGAGPSEQLLERSTWMVNTPLSRSELKSYTAAMYLWLHEEWMITNYCAIALGAPDGLPLREEMAAGDWDNAVVELCSEDEVLSELAGPPQPCQRWRPLPPDAVPSIPFGMTADQAREAGPPWSWARGEIPNCLTPWWTGSERPTS